MTSKERIIAALEGKPVDHLPFCPFLAYVWESWPRDLQDKGQLAFLKSIGADPLWRCAPSPVACSTPGVEHNEYTQGINRVHEISTPVGSLREVYAPSPEGNTWFLMEHPLRMEDDYKTMLWIEEHTTLAVNLEPVREHFRNDGREGLSLGCPIHMRHGAALKSAFQALIEHYAGTVELVYALMDFSETVETLWQAMVANNIAAVRLAAEADAYDYFLTYEDSGTQNYSPDMYETYIASEIGQWCDILAASGKKYIQHACGHVKELIVPMKNSGVFALESLSPPPTGNISLKDARAAAGSSFGFIGGIEPTELLNRSIEELTPYVEQVIEDGRGGPFVLANADSCPPGVSPEKFRHIAAIAECNR